METLDILQKLCYKIKISPKRKLHSVFFPSKVLDFLNLQKRSKIYSNNMKKLHKLEFAARFNSYDPWKRWKQKFETKVRWKILGSSWQLVQTKPHLSPLTILTYKNA